MKTPLQRVLNGDKTIEGYIEGKGKLTITKPDGKKIVHVVGESSKPLELNVKVGEIMQWQASPSSTLTAYEVCYPPYKDGRYENID
ncbi:hypothetical protein HY024_03530 [Candidatus Curtissbacteria bacterium]|nr:hypothetical protein [Candidatus Curtissbacteria bacterium]